jgi:hypothetical protein
MTRPHQKTVGVDVKECLPLYNWCATRWACSVASVLSSQWAANSSVRGCVAIVRELAACTEHSSVRIKQPAVFEFFIAEGVFPIEVNCRMQVVYGDDCPWNIIIKAHQEKKKKLRQEKPLLQLSWVADGVIHMDFHEPGFTINSALHCNTQNFETTTKKSSATQEHFAGA